MKKRFGCRTLLVALMVLALSMGVFGCGKADKAQQGSLGTDVSVNVEEYHADGTDSGKTDAPETEKESSGTAPETEKDSSGTGQGSEKDTASGDKSDHEINANTDAAIDFEIVAGSENSADAESGAKQESEKGNSGTIAESEIDTTADIGTKSPSQKASEEGSDESGQDAGLPVPDEDGAYTSKEDVALYIHVYGKLPSNFITKKQAKKLGWTGGSLEEYAPGKCIGGDYFGNYEGLLPKDQEYYECDIDTLGKKKRGAKRIIYSDDGHIYYTDDHYESFELLYAP
jgi:hypothetical protein